MYVLRAEASYSLDGILINLYTLDGAGNMVIDLTNVDLNLYAGLSIDDQGYVQINGLQLDADFNDANLQLEHLNLDGDLSESISRVISRYVPKGDFFFRKCDLFFKSLQSPKKNISEKSS